LSFFKSNLFKDSPSYYHYIVDWSTWREVSINVFPIILHIFLCPMVWLHYVWSMKSVSSSMFLSTICSIWTVAAVIILAIHWKISVQSPDKALFLSSSYCLFHQAKQHRCFPGCKYSWGIKLITHLQLLLRSENVGSSTLSTPICPSGMPIMWTVTFFHFHYI
jgi:hypothetical protein